MHSYPPQLPDSRFINPTPLQEPAEEHTVSHPPTIVSFHPWHASTPFRVAPLPEGQRSTQELRAVLERDHRPFSAGHRLSSTQASALSSTRTLRRSSPACGLRTAPFSATMISARTLSHRRLSKKEIRYLIWSSCCYHCYLSSSP